MLFCIMQFCIMQFCKTPPLYRAHRHPGLKKVLEMREVGSHGPVGGGRIGLGKRR